MQNKGREWVSWAQVVLGLIFGSLGYRLFLVPNDIAAGGFTGIGQLINAFTGWPVGMIALVLNLPLFALSMRRLGLGFGLRSLLSMIALSLLIDHLPVPPVTDDALLSSVFGGVMAGFGFGLVLRGDATTGGSDMLGKVINDHFPAFSIGAISFAVDALVIVGSAFVFSATRAMQALVAAYLMNRMLDMVLEGLNLAKAYYIISNESETIAARILTELDRGVTGLNGRGMYSGDSRLVLLCVVGRLETARLRRIVAETDPAAFMIATEVHEALGEGFMPHKK
ncbi:YitT family protein [Bacillota bacterium Meth-B3]